MEKEYHVQDMPLAELEQSFVEKFFALSLYKGLSHEGLICYLKCLRYVVNIMFLPKYVVLKLVERFGMW